LPDGLKALKMNNFTGKKRTAAVFLKKNYPWLIFAVLIAALSPSLWNVYRKARGSNDNLKMAEAELAKLQNRQAALLKSIGELKTSRGIEAEVREKFSVVKLGEEVIVVVDGAENSDDSSDSGVNQSFWSRIAGWFGLR
jgi:cell division protein FtsB